MAGKRERKEREREREEGKGKGREGEKEKYLSQVFQAENGYFRETLE